MTRKLGLTALLMVSVACVGAVQAQDEKGGKQDAPAASSGGESSGGPSSGGESGSDGASAKQDAPKQEKQAQDAPKQDKSAPKSDRAQTDKSGGPETKSAQDKSGQPKEKSAQGKEDRPSQAQAPKADDSKQAKEDAAKADAPKQPKEDTAKSDAPPAKDDAKQASGDKKGADEVKKAELSGDKREKVVTAFKSKTTVKERTNVNIDIRVGTRLPGDWEYYAVPDDILVIAPEYRGYRYSYVEGDYVIVEPDTYEVVAVLDADGGSSATGVAAGTSGSSRSSGSGTCDANLSLSQEDRAFIIEEVRDSPAVGVDIGGLTVGLDLPDEVEVQTFPAEITSRVTSIGGCRYVVVDEKVALVDPDADKVVLVIEK